MAYAIDEQAALLQAGIDAQYNLMTGTDLTPTKIQSKQQKLLERTDTKKSNLGILESIYDADTYTMQGDPSSTRALGVDAYESTKSGSWFNNPYNVRRMATQRAKLANELGRTVTNEDVFAMGDKQKAEAKVIQQSNLPVIVDNFQRLNPNPYDKSPQNNYGRNLGAIRTIGGMYSLPDDTAVSGEVSIGVMPGAAPVKAPGAANYLDALQFGIGRKAAGVADSIVDAGIRLGKEVVKGFTDMTEEQANAKISSKLKDTMFSNLIDDKGDFVGLDAYKKAEEYGYDDANTKKAMENLAVQWDTGTTGDKVAALFATVWTAGPELVFESAGEFLTGPLGKLGIVLNTTDYSNQILEDVEGEVTNARRAAAIIGGTGMAMLNKLGADEAFGNTKVVKEAFKAVLNAGSSRAAIEGIKAIAKVGLVATGKAGYEGLEEVAQESIQQVISKYGTDAEHELTDGTTGRELFQVFGGGFGAGGSISLAGGAVGLVGKGAKKIAGSDVVTSKIDAIKETAKAAKDAVSGGVSYAKGVVSSNPDMDLAVVEKAVQDINEGSMSDLNDASQEDDAAVKTTTVDRDVHAQAIHEIHKQHPTAQEGSVEAAEDLSSKVAKDLFAKSEAFDEVYASSVDEIQTAMKEILTAKEAGDTTDYTKQLQPMFAGGVNQLVEMRDEIAEIAGKDSDKVALIDRKIQMLVPLASASTEADMSAIINSDKIDTTSKVSVVLGSSAASIEQVEQILKSEDLSVDERAILELKRDALTFNDVQKQKLTGGGARPGALQWASKLVAGKDNTTIIGKITDFVQGQDAKLGKFSKAVSTWDKDNNMPWVGMGKKAALAKYPLAGSSLNSRVFIRSETTKEAKTNISLTHGDSSYSHIARIANLAEIMQVEQANLSKLQTYADSFSAPSEPQRATQKPVKVTEDEVVKDVVTEPVAAKDDAEVAIEEIEVLEKKVAKAKEASKAKPKIPKLTVTPKNKNGITTYRIDESYVYVNQKGKDTYLSMLFVDEVDRRQGIADKLIKRVIKDFGKDPIHLFVDSSEGISEKVLITMYEKYGFVLQDDVTDDMPKMIRGEIVKAEKTAVADFEAQVDAKAEKPKAQVQEAIRERSPEIRTVAKDPESKYNAGTKEAIIHLISTRVRVQQFLKENGIDIKDC